MSGRCCKVDEHDWVETDRRTGDGDGFTWVTYRCRKCENGTEGRADLPKRGGRFPGEAVWCIQIRWLTEWVTVETGYQSRDAAEWAVGQWKRDNKCYNDPFRAVREDEPGTDHQEYDVQTDHGRMKIAAGSWAEAEALARGDGHATQEAHA